MNRYCGSDAAVACLPSKQVVAGSNPVSRSKMLSPIPAEARTEQSFTGLPESARSGHSHSMLSLQSGEGEGFEWQVHVKDHATFKAFPWLNQPAEHQAWINAGRL